MTLAFLTGALASGVTAAGLTTILIWLATVVSGSNGAWSIAPALIGVAAAAIAIATYVAERTVYRRSRARMRATGEPWAFRDG